MLTNQTCSVNNVNPKTHFQFSQLLRVPVVRPAFQYLGLWVTRKPNRSFPADYGLVWKCTSGNLMRWNKMNQLLSSRLTAVKMMTQEVPVQCFKIWQQILESFIFKSERSHTSKTLRYWKMSGEGWGVPLLKSYCEAYQIRHLLSFMNGSWDTQWV